MGNRIRNILDKYKRWALVLYFPFYMTWFVWLEHRNVSSYTSIHCGLDDRIPFCVYFAIPYFLWFGYVVIGIGILLLQKKYPGDLYRLAAILMLGMTTALIVYTLFPNAQNLRPEHLAGNDILTRWVINLYHTDTATNVCPSIHVYNSLCIHVALAKSRLAKKNTWWPKAMVGISLILCVSISLSTMFIKQHSFVDVVCAILMYLLYYYVVYHRLIPMNK